MWDNIQTFFDPANGGRFAIWLRLEAVDPADEETDYRILGFRLVNTTTKNGWAEFQRNRVRWQGVSVAPGQTIEQLSLPSGQRYTLDTMQFNARWPE